MGKITFKDLSIPIKIGIVLAWITGLLFIMYFSLGFLVGILLSVMGVW